MMGKVIMSGIVPQLEEPVSYKANFADNEWATIVDACQKNKVPDTWAVGDQKTMTINGTNYLIDIIGKNHDNYADGSGKAPLTFQMHDCYATQYRMHSGDICVWKSCEMRTTTLPTIMALMPSEVQAGIREVTKLSCNGGGSTATTKSIDKLFFLSSYEVCESPTQYSVEGNQYEYYAAGNSKAKTRNGSTEWWRTRSPHTYNTYGFYSIKESGKPELDNAPNIRSIAFAFCF